MHIQRTTINLPAPLVEKAKVHAVKRKTTLTQLIIEGLQLRLKLTSARPQKSLTEFLKSLPVTPFQKLSDKEIDQRYREALESKYGSPFSGR